MLIVILAVAATVQQAAIQPSKRLLLNVSPETALTSPGGVEVIRAGVSSAGTVFKCEASIVGRGPVVDKENCVKVTRLKATPAFDQNGYKTYGTAEFYVTWSTFRLGSSAPAVPRTADPDFYLPLGHRPEGLSSDATSRLTLIVGTDGKVETCETQRTSGIAVLDSAAYRAVAAAGVAPLKDETGTAVRAVHSVTVGYSIEP